MIKVCVYFSEVSPHTIVSLDVHLPLVSNSFLPKIFADKDASAQPSLWETLTLFTKARPQSWMIASAKKPLTKKYLAFLKSGAHGFGSVSYPCQLALIAFIPHEIFEGGLHTFALSFLVELWNGGQGLDKDESIQVLFYRSYFECAWFLVLEAIKGGSDYSDILNQGFLLPLKGVLVLDKVQLFCYVNVKVSHW